MIHREEVEAIEAVKKIAGGAGVTKEVLRPIFQLMLYALRNANVGSVEERVTAIKRLIECQFWIELGYSNKEDFEKRYGSGS